MRVVAWFSCGAASACAAKLAIEGFGLDVEVVYCDTSTSEHPDNARFMADVERWLNRPVTIIRSQHFVSVDEVFERTRYMAGIAGARCTTEMKKIPRFLFQHPDDVHVFGYTSDEGKRITRFEANNPDMSMSWVLRDAGMDKAACLRMIEEAGMVLPAMYRLGYKNNNCLGCVKATSPGYWNKIRQDFPEVFERRARQSRAIGARLVRYKGERIFLDELPATAKGKQENISCGPECAIGGAS